jgi:hypothetical protein
MMLWWCVMCDECGDGSVISESAMKFYGMSFEVR